ncbi:MAG: hypothetical protein JST93_12415 [Acidobacteria bacterium]|nr:hypothetical protein [Acidobacteriota bacterium]
MTFPDEERPPVARIASTNKGPGAPKAGAGPEADPHYIQLLSILDRYPDVKRQVIEGLSKEK